MSTLSTIAIALGLADKLMDKVPDYDQRKKEKYYKLKRKYNEEISKKYSERDDHLIGCLSDELCDFLETFNEEI